MPLMPTDLRRLGCRALIGLLALLPMGAARALSCSATMTNIAYGNVTPWSGNVDVSGTLNYSCTVTLLDLLSLGGFTACFSITTGTHPEVMSDGASHTLNHELYLDASHSTIWGSRFGGTGSPILINQGGISIAQTFTGSVPIYARLTAGQTSAIPASYSQSFAGANTEVAVTGGLLAPPGACSGGNTGVRFPFTATATIPVQCDSGFTTSTLDFGTAGLLSANVNATATIGPRCTNTTPYQIGLDNGQNASGSTRRMKNGSSFVSYELYRDSGRTLRWGNTLNVDTVSATGTGTSQSNTVYGRVAPQTTPAAGSYTDTVLVTITY